MGGSALVTASSAMAMDHGKFAAAVRATSSRKPSFDEVPNGPVKAESRAEGHELFLALVNIAPTPQLATSRCKRQVEPTAVAEPIRLLLGLGFLYLKVRQRHLSSSPLAENTPSALSKVPPSVPPRNTGFHKTSLDVEIRNPQSLLGI